MSEQNILNPTQASDLNPYYGSREQIPASIASWQSRSGDPSSRRLLSRGRTFELSWENVLCSTADKLRQWEAQYEQGFFTLADYERGRYFSGRFAAPLGFSNIGNDRWNVQGQFIELPRLAMYQYPTNWNRDAIFIEESDDFGKDLVKVVGTWGARSGPSAINHGQYCYDSNTTNDTAEWQYFGYGFRVWSPKTNNAGIVEVSLDGVVLGTADCYSAASVASAAVYTKSDVALGMHRVKLRVTGNKNAGSAGTWVFADAIEVMR